MRIALTGNPNSGKTTMFNALTGSNEKVGNWAGVTVEKKEHLVKKLYCGDAVCPTAVDLPGAYSMSPFTNEESVTRDYILNENPDVIVNIVDGTNLSRSLFFTTQLLELGIPMVVALNKTDINEKKKTAIDTAVLSQKLGCSVIETVSVSADGLKEVVSTALAQVGKGQAAPYVQGAVDPTDKAAVLEADRRRFAFVNGIVAQVERRAVHTNERNVQDKVDGVLTNKWLGIPIFAVVMFLVFQISQAWVGPWIAEGVELPNGTVIPGLVTLIDLFGEWVGRLLEGAHPLVNALLVDGIIGGVGAVVGFLPLVMVMYFFIALLEDCGYMSRVAVVLDPIFKKVGLSGKSVIPFVIGVGCAVPGVMASRTIRNERERRATAMLAPFMPCGAKIPVISLFAGAFFDNAGWVSTVMYLTGILVIFVGALLVNGVTGNRVKKSYFIIEMPEYKFPSLWGAFKSMCSRGWSYIVKAATIILLCNTAVHIMQSFTWRFSIAQTADESILATVAVPFAYALIPVVGILSWKLAAAVVTGFIAKENVVGTLAVCFVGMESMLTEELFFEGYGTPLAAAFGITRAAALAYLMFNLFSPPCFAAIGAMNAEMKSAKWLWGGIGLQLGMGYTIGFGVYQIGTLISTGSFGSGFWYGLAVVLVFAAAVLWLTARATRRVRTELNRRAAEKAAAGKG